MSHGTAASPERRVLGMLLLLAVVLPRCGGSREPSAPSSPAAVTPAPTPSPSPACGLGFVPFIQIYAVAGPASNGDRLVVGQMSVGDFQRVRALPLPASPNELVCGTVVLGPGYTGRAYVPTAAERQGDYSGIAIVVRDPLTGQPFPGNVVPANRLPNPFAWRVPRE